MRPASAGRGYFFTKHGRHVTRRYSMLMRCRASEIRPYFTTSTQPFIVVPGPGKVSR